MTTQRHAMSISVILWVSVVLMLFIFILVAHHRNIAERVERERNARAASWGVAERIKPVGQASVPSAETRREPSKTR